MFFIFIFIFFMFFLTKRLNFDFFMLFLFLLAQVFYSFHINNYTWEHFRLTLFLCLLYFFLKFFYSLFFFFKEYFLFCICSFFQKKLVAKVAFFSPARRQYWQRRYNQVFVNFSVLYHVKTLFFLLSCFFVLFYCFFFFVDLHFV